VRVPPRRARRGRSAAADEFRECDRGERQIRRGRLHERGERLQELALNPLGVVRALAHLGRSQQGAQERQIGHDAMHVRVVERAEQALDREFARGPMRDDLREHRVVMHVHRVAGIEPMVHAHERPARPVHAQRGAGLRQEPARGVLGVHAHLDRMPVTRQAVLLPRELPRRGHLELRAHQIDAGDELGHGMLDLEPRVHLEEVHLPLARQQHLDRARAAVLHRLGESHGRMGDLRAQIVRERGARGLLDDLLMAPLQRAVAIPQVHRAAAPVAEHLHLDVARVLEQLLDVHARIAERRGRESLRALDTLAQLGLVPRGAHALAAAAPRRLDDDGIAHRVRRAHERLDVGALGAGHDRHARRARRCDAPRACRPWTRSARASGPRTPALPPRPRARTPRSRRGTRSPDARRRRRPHAPPRRWPRC
jgi:hypothetical protein